MLVHKINFKMSITICLRKNLTKVSLRRKKKKLTKTTKITSKHKKREKEIPSQLNPFFRKIFDMQFTIKQT